jgi:hypothetical protein
MKKLAIKLKGLFWTKNVALFFLSGFALTYPISGISQVNGSIANYVTNGGFEEHYTCVGPKYISNAKGWRTLDSSLFTGIVHYSDCYTTSYVPSDGTGRYQWPKKGRSFGMTAFLCQFPCVDNPNRGYFRNRLKKGLEVGKTYCVKFYYNVANNSNYGIDSFGAYFGDDYLDTITKGFARITYLNPQVQNPQGNIATDTLNWSATSGTFTANGTEKHMVIGNFKSDTMTNKLFINPLVQIYIFCDMNIDHVSCIPIDLPAFAGPDKWFLPGDSVYVGRESDVEVDESCIWYQMTSPTTSLSIDTIAGLWVKPVATTTYVLRQQLWCSGVKWDTVVVSLSGVGISEMEAIQNNIRLFPNPASDNIHLQYTLDMDEPFSEIAFYNYLGQLIYEGSISFKNKKASIPISNLDIGVYSLELKYSSGQSIKKRLVLAR